MSISDMIIVMKSGQLHQMGLPQSVYNEPVNLFVAKFLGTPAINVFDGYVKDKKLYIGDDCIMDKDIEDQEVYVAIRPEGFVPKKNGCLHCVFDRIEIMGRDTSIVCHHDKCISDVDIRTIVDSDIKIYHDDKNISFDLKENKTHVFSKKDENVL